MSVLAHAAFGHPSQPLAAGLTSGCVWLVLAGEQAWKQPGRVRALLDDGEELTAVFPARRLARGASSRTSGGYDSCFVVLTNRRVLVFAHNRLVDVPTGLVLDAPRRTCAAELRADGRRLTVHRGDEHQEFRVSPRRRGVVGRFVVALNRGWW
ncbi:MULTISPECIES: hypothetical protein [unclassified Streptomyces]|uniref:hypothetical protein n=1 Tax=Streptomyces sp. SYP-A7185 TaxID=3040076 RepID=UPI0038F80953